MESIPMHHEYVPSSSSVHDSLASTLSECIIKVGAVVLSQVVANEWLTTILVDTLENLGWCESTTTEKALFRTNLVSSGVTQTWEERSELAGDRRVGELPKDDLVESAGRRNLFYSSVSQSNSP
jgi:hypothetical protein